MRKNSEGTVVVPLNGLVALGLLLLAGCAGIGPPTVARDRFDYVSAISESWKRQTLLNLAKTRYMDAPVFMDVISVINQYAVEAQINLSATWVDDPGTDNRTLGATGKYTDRPTITYSPIMGEKFTRSYMTPIPIPGILFMLQSGYAADYVLRMCVQTINGIDNQFGASASGTALDPRFRELITSMRNIQRAGGLGMRVQPEGDQRAMVIFFRPPDDPAIAAELQKVKELLGLDPQAREFRIV